MACLIFTSLDEDSKANIAKGRTADGKYGDHFAPTWYPVYTEWLQTELGINTNDKIELEWVIQFMKHTYYKNRKP